MQIERKRGDTAPDVIKVTFHADGETVNLAGCSFLLTVDRRAAPDNNSTQLFQLEGVINDPATGIVEFNPTLAQVDYVGYFYYDIQMTDSHGKIHTPISGSYVFKQDITK